MTDSIRQLYRDYAHAMKWWVVEADVMDDEYLENFFRGYSVDALQMHYASDRLSLEEFEYLCGLAVGLGKH